MKVENIKLRDMLGFIIVRIRNTIVKEKRDGKD